MKFAAMTQLRAPNTLVQSSLFAVAENNETLDAALPAGFIERTLATPGNVKLLYKGPRLNQIDLDVYAALLGLLPFDSSANGAGVAVAMSYSALAERTGATSFAASVLHARQASLLRLSQGQVNVYIDGRHILLSHLVLELDTRHQHGFSVLISEKIAGLFSRGATVLPAEQRANLASRSLVAWLHSWVLSYGGCATSYATVDELFRLSGSAGSDAPLLDRSQVAGFRRRLEKSLFVLRDELQVIESFSIVKGKVTVLRWTVGQPKPAGLLPAAAAPVNPDAPRRRVRTTPLVVAAPLSLADLAAPEPSQGAEVVTLPVHPPAPPDPAPKRFPTPDQLPGIGDPVHGDLEQLGAEEAAAMDEANAAEVDNVQEEEQQEACSARQAVVVDPALTLEKLLAMYAEADASGRGYYPFDIAGYPSGEVKAAFAAAVADHKMDWQLERYVDELSIGFYFTHKG